VRSLQHKGLTVEGYSRAAVQTYWRIPELKLGFDLGAQPWSFMTTPTWFVTHTHLDHVAALPVLVARRRMMKMEPPTIYLPAEAVEGVELLLRAMQRLDRGRLPTKLVGLAPGAEVELSRELVVKAFATKHTLPSLGYLVWERRKKLKPEVIAEFQSTIGEMGYKFQFVTLAGFHALNLSMFRLAKGYAQTGMAAYTELQEDEFRAEEEGYAAVKHQSFVGTGYFDEVAQILSGGLTSTLAMEGSTETEQFMAAKEAPRKPGPARERSPAASKAG
jgi:hypothetical protein